VAVNIKYGILICLGNTCHRAVRPAGLAAHVRRKHKVPRDIWRQVEQYIKGFPFEYDYSSVPLPVDGLAPQPIIQVVDGLQCRHCTFKTQSRDAMKKHGNKEHSMQRVANDELFQPARLQSWFWDGKERYWVVDESQQVAQERRARRAAIGDVGEESNPEANTSGGSSGSGSGGRSGSEDSQDDGLSDGLDDIVEDIEGWKADARERLLEALKEVPAAEIDAWLHFTGWSEVLGQSRHDLVKTHQFARPPDPDEPELERVLRAWRRILERCLDTLAATDQKDALKWWGSPKNEAASQRPFELPQNAQTVEKYSAIWERFICYMMRTALVERWEDETGEWVDYYKDYYNFHYS
jgi:Orsellinic acid/F9775 biosynthesis cluster protein D